MPALYILRQCPSRISSFEKGPKADIGTCSALFFGRYYVLDLISWGLSFYPVADWERPFPMEQVDRLFRHVWREMKRTLSATV